MDTQIVQQTARPRRRVPRYPTESTNPWLVWRVESPPEAHPLTVAELDECRCPDLCNRDHDND